MNKSIVHRATNLSTINVDNPVYKCMYNSTVIHTHLFRPVGMLKSTHLSGRLTHLIHSFTPKKIINLSILNDHIIIVDNILN